MAIHIDSCAKRAKVVVHTRSSVYELIVLRPERGLVLIRGGMRFPKFRRALFLGSAAHDGTVTRHTIDLGLRMKFLVARRIVTTSPVQSESRAPSERSETHASCAAAQGASRAIPIASSTEG